MATEINDSLEEVRQELKKYLKVKITEFMENVAKELQVAYEESVDLWYNEYEPEDYDRTFNTYYASNAYEQNDFHKYINVEETEDGFEAEASIVISEDTMHDWYKRPVSWVFPRTWEQGLHGNIKINKGLPKPSVPPKTTMDIKYDHLINFSLYRMLRKYGF